MFFDLNVPVPPLNLPSGQTQSKKAKGKQPQQPQSAIHTAAQVSAIETRIDLLVHLGYTVVALNQTVHKKVDAKTHVNAVDSLLGKLRKRTGIVFLKRLTIILDADSEKGFGLTNANASLLSPYDLIALTPTTAACFSLACLTHSLPSQLTAHIIALPLTLPRLPFHLKHTLVRTAIKNGAVFEINYAGALGGYGDPVVVDFGGGEGGPSAKRNWWPAAREVVRVTKGKGFIVSGGVASDPELRAPRDVGNLITLLGVSQDAAHDASTRSPKSLVLRAQTRKTYRAVLSEPKLVVPGDVRCLETQESREDGSQGTQTQSHIEFPMETPSLTATEVSVTPHGNKKRPRHEDGPADAVALSTSTSKINEGANAGIPEQEGSSRKKKKKTRGDDEKGRGSNK